VLDEELGDGTRSGLELVKELRGLDPDLAIVAVADSGDLLE
jgi:hypothetical protein